MRDKQNALKLPVLQGRYMCKGKRKSKSIKGRKKEETLFHMCDGQRKSSALSLFIGKT
jgi:hypothetical protein